MAVVLVPHLHGPEAETDMLRDLAAAISAKGAEVTTPTVGTLDDYRRTLAEADVVVSMRHHGLILAAHAGVPCVSLVYENKMIEAATYLGLSALALEVGSASQAEIEARLREALDRPSSLMARMNTRTALARQTAAGPLLEAAARLIRSN